MLTESSAIGISTEIRRPTSCDGDGYLRVIPRPKIEISMTLQPWGPVDSLSILHVPSQRAGWRGTPRRWFMGKPSLVGATLAVLGSVIASVPSSSDGRSDAGMGRV